MITVLPDNRILAAPLAGVSDTVYRTWARRFSAGMVFTEMISAEGLRRGDRKTLSMLAFGRSERPIGIQLFDDTPNAMAEAAKIAQDREFDLIDINIGCPARKVVGKGAGACLLREPQKAAKIVEAVIESVDIPVSVKMRSGWDVGDDTYLKLIPMLADLGAAFITLHPRSRAEMFRGRADWDKIRRAVEISSVPIVGNGDIHSADDAVRMLDETGCYAVMIGRASFGNPWIFDEVSSAISGGSIPEKPDVERRLEACAEYARDLVEHYGEERGVRLARKHVVWFTGGIPGSKSIRAKAVKAKTLSGIYEALNDRKAVARAS